MSKSVYLLKSSNCPEKTRAGLAKVAACHALLLGLFGLVAVTASAQTTPQSSPATVQTSSTGAPLPVTTANVTTGAISIDGRLDESAWSRAQPITDFHQ